MSLIRKKYNSSEMSFNIQLIMWKDTRIMQDVRVKLVNVNYSAVKI